MKIAVIAEVFLPKVDGVVMRTMRLLEHLSRQGDETIVFCPRAKQCEHESIRTVSFASFACPSYPEYQIGIPSPELIRTMQEFRPDVIHFLNPFAFGFRCYDMLSRAEIAAPTVFSFHTLYGEFVKQYPMLGLLSGPLWRLTRSYHNCADVNLTVSEAMRQDLEQRGFERVRTWPPAVDTALFHPDRRSTTMRQRLMSGPDDRPLLLTVSRLAPEKNVGLLSQLSSRFPDARLAVVGDGPDRARLERMFDAQRTTFTGYLRGTELASAYASADLFVYASETETMGNVVLEAMSSGLPVLAPNAGGIRSLIKHEDSGLLYRPGSADDLHHSLRRLLDDDALRCGLGHNAREHVLECGWRSSVEEVRRNYQVAIERFATEGRRSRSSKRGSSLSVSTLVRAFQCSAQVQSAAALARRTLMHAS